MKILIIHPFRLQILSALPFFDENFQEISTSVVEAFTGKWWFEISPRSEGYNVFSSKLATQFPPISLLFL
jgi:hypothetical protein